MELYSTPISYVSQKTLTRPVERSLYRQDPFLKYAVIEKISPFKETTGIYPHCSSGSGTWPNPSIPLLRQETIVLWGLRLLSVFLFLNLYYDNNQTIEKLKQMAPSGDAPSCTFTVKDPTRFEEHMNRRWSELHCESSRITEWEDAKTERSIALQSRPNFKQWPSIERYKALMPIGRSTVHIWENEFSRSGRYCAFCKKEKKTHSRLPGIPE